MPSGIPVATVAINGGKNAGILAAKMLAMSNPAILERLKKLTTDMKDQVIAKDAKLADVGYENY
jgi:5-(carboxyamino)imidazole ribonucleotide mutase